MKTCSLSSKERQVVNGFLNGNHPLRIQETKKCYLKWLPTEKHPMPTKNDFLVQGQKCVQINKVENIITRIYANKYTCFIAKAAVILN